MKKLTGSLPKRMAKIVIWTMVLLWSVYFIGKILMLFSFVGEMGESTVVGPYLGKVRMDDFAGTWHYMPNDRGDYFLIFASSGVAVQASLDSSGMSIVHITSWTSGMSGDLIADPIVLDHYFDPWDLQEKKQYELILGRSAVPEEIVLWAGRPEYEEYHRLSTMPPKLLAALRNRQNELPDDLVELMKNDTGAKDAFDHSTSISPVRDNN